MLSLVVKGQPPQVVKGLDGIGGDALAGKGSLIEWHLGHARNDLFEPPQLADLKLVARHGFGLDPKCDFQ